MESKLKNFLLIYIFSVIPSLIIYLVSIYGFDNCDTHLGCFGLFSVFSIYVFVWGFVGGLGVIASTFFTKASFTINLPLKCLVILGLIIGCSHFIVQLNIENSISLLPLSFLIAFCVNLFMSHLVTKTE
jgi:hypothetical protein